MKLLLLRVLLQRRARDEGFTLPMVIALGLVMILLGTTNIVKSSEENLNATIQNSSSDALAVAEVGITKYRELLNQNRILTIYNHDQWNTNAAIVGADTSVTTDDQTCNDMTTTPTGWSDGDGNSGTNPPANDTTQWWEIREDLNGDGDTTDDDDLVGEYRLVSYEYDRDGLSIAKDEDDDGNLDDTTPNNENGVFNVSADVNRNYPADTSNDNDTNDDGESDAVGILTIQGQSPDGSVAQIEVQIPLRINPEEMAANLAPVLWIGSRDSSYTSSFTGNVGTITIPSDSNIVRFVTGCSDPADIGTNSVISDGRGVPSITSIVNKITEAETAGSINTSLPAAPLELGNTSDKPYVTPADGTFSATDECKNISNCRYYYKLGATTISSNTETDGISKVTLYVDGDLTINEDIIGSAVSSNYLEIYVTSAGNITIDSDNVDTVNAFIHAPNSTLTVNGTGTVNIVGSVWVDKFINNATVNFGDEDPVGTFNTETTKISSQTSVPTYALYTTTSDRTPRPLTSSPSNWIREEVE